MGTLAIGGEKGADVRDRGNWERNTELLVYDRRSARARNRLDWLLRELGGRFGGTQ